MELNNELADETTPPELTEEVVARLQKQARMEMKQKEQEETRKGIKAVELAKRIARNRAKEKRARKARKVNWNR